MILHIFCSKRWLYTHLSDWWNIFILFLCDLFAFRPLLRMIIWLLWRFLEVRQHPLYHTGPQRVWWICSCLIWVISYWHRVSAETSMNCLVASSEVQPLKGVWYLIMGALLELALSWFHSATRIVAWSDKDMIIWDIVQSLCCTAFLTPSIVCNTVSCGQLQHILAEELVQLFRAAILSSELCFWPATAPLSHCE